LEVLHYDIFTVVEAMYFIKRSLARRENSTFMLNSRDGSSGIPMDGKGTPPYGHIICKSGQLTWYCWRELRRGHIICKSGQLAWYCWTKLSRSVLLKCTTDLSGCFTSWSGIWAPESVSDFASRLDEHYIYLVQRTRFSHLGDFGHSVNESFQFAPNLSLSQISYFCYEAD